MRGSSPTGATNVENVAQLAPERQPSVDMTSDVICGNQSCSTDGKGKHEIHMNCMGVSLLTVLLLLTFDVSKGEGSMGQRQISETTYLTYSTLQLHHHASLA